MPSGAEVLHLDGQFLAMDWRNNPRDTHYVKVTPKHTLVRPPPATVYPWCYYIIECLVCARELHIQESDRRNNSHLVFPCVGFVYTQYSDSKTHSTINLSFPPPTPPTHTHPTHTGPCGRPLLGYRGDPWWWWSFPTAMPRTVHWTWATHKRRSLVCQ